MTLIFATHNKNKLLEIQSQLPHPFELQSLKDLAYFKNIPEPYLTVEENAATKANTIYNAFSCACFSDDTGLFVNALEGAPGVFSARYAGENAKADQNMDKLLKAMTFATDRSAYFKTCIALKLDHEIKYFSGVVHGSIAKAKKGAQGFGYDPIFIPEGYQESFAELPLEIKQKIGHRGKAIKQLIDYLTHLQ